MLKKLRKAILSPLIAARWINSLESAAENDFVSAQRSLNYLAEFFDGNNAEYHLLSA
jgi:hypothetical protein